MNAYPQAITVQSGRRDGYQLPWALHEADLLLSLVTELYWPVDKSWFSQSVGKLLSDRVINLRFTPGIPSDKVRMSWKALAGLLASRVTSRNFNHFSTTSLDAYVKRIALENPGHALFCYDYWVTETFNSSENLSPFRFLFQIHPAPLSVRNILQDELERTPFAAESLWNEAELKLKDEVIQSRVRAAQSANGWVVASRFTAKTLAESGIPLEKIYVVPYGVNHASFPARSRPPISSRPLRIIFVGSMIQRKGISDLFEAVRLLRTRQIELILCGRGFIDRNVIRHYKEIEPEIKVNLPQHKLIKEIHASDVFVFPSLVEGFGHVILESMSCGIPVIATSHTCAPDVLQDGVQGFVVPIRAPEVIAEKLAWSLDHRMELADMGTEAAQHSRYFTWARFRGGIREAYKNMIDSARGTDFGTSDVHN